MHNVDMKKLFLALLTLGVIAGALSCEEKTAIDSGDPVIKTGSLGGLCGSWDSLTLTQSKTYYEFHKGVCQSGSQDKNQQSDTEEWNELLAKLDWEKFKALNPATSDVAVDGIDTWISVEKNGEYHRIKFGDTNLSSTYTAPEEVESVKAFVEELRARRSAQ